MAGWATVTIVTSNSSMKTPAQTASRVHHFLSIDFLHQQAPSPCAGHHAARSNLFKSMVQATRALSAAQLAQLPRPAGQDPPTRAAMLAEDEPLIRELARDGRASCAALAA